MTNLAQVQEAIEECQIHADRLEKLIESIPYTWQLVLRARLCWAPFTTSVPARRLARYLFNDDLEAEALAEHQACVHILELLEKEPPPYARLRKMIKDRGIAERDLSNFIMTFNFDDQMLLRAYLGLAPFVTAWELNTFSGIITFDRAQVKTHLSRLAEVVLQKIEK